MATTASEIQALYVAYFNRPAEPLGLQFWLDRANANGGADFVANEFANSTEYTETYAGKSYLQIVDTIYMNLFGRHAEAAGLTYWALKLQNGELGVGNVARIISTSAQNSDLVAVNSKLAAAAAFTASLTTGEELLGYDGPAANAVVKAWLTGITTAADVTADTTATAMDVVAAAAAAAKEQANATSAVLTSGTDTLIGTANADKFIADAGKFTAFDSIDGALGNDSLTVTEIGADITTAGKTVVNVETATLRGDQAIDANTTGWTGLTALNVTGAGSAGAAAVSLTAAATTAIAISNATATTIGSAGGKSVTISDSTATGALTVTSKASPTITLDSVTIGAPSTITDNSTSAKVLTTVVLDTVAVTGGLTVVGDALTNLSIAHGTGTDITLNNGTSAGFTLNLSLNDNDSFLVDDSNDFATAVAVTLVDDSALELDVTGAKALTVAGNGVLTLDGTTGDLAAVKTVTVSGAAGLASVLSSVSLTSFDASASTADNAVTLKGNVAEVAIKGGAGADTVITTGALDAKAVVDLGAGADTYKMAAAATAGAAVEGGAGSDTLAVTDGSWLTTDIYTGFEVLEVGSGTGTYDMDAVSGLKAVTLGAALAGDIVIDNAAAGVSLEIKSTAHTDLAVGHDIAVALKTDTATSAFTVTLSAVDGNDDGTAQGSITTGLITANDMETINVVSQATKLDADDAATTSTDESTVASDYTHTIGGLTDTSLTTLNVTGGSNLVFTALTAIALTKIDAHAMTGALTVDASGAHQSVEFLGGSLGDTYTATAFGDTINAGAGADVITLDAGFVKTDTIIVEAGDSVLNKDHDGADAITNFGTVAGGGALDSIDLGSFGFTGTRASALANKGVLAATVTDGTVLTQTDFFASGGFDRAVAIGTIGSDTFVFVDVNKDGDFKAGDDLMIKLVGVTDVSLGNFGF